MNMYNPTRPYDQLHGMGLIANMSIQLEGKLNLSVEMGDFVKWLPCLLRGGRNKICIIVANRTRRVAILAHLEA